jgi:tetratricopeptide (TPR) repeat protein/cytochrome c553
LAVAAATVAAVAAGAFWWQSDRASDVAKPAAPPALRFVGATACAECHAEETKRWTGSHHDLAMAPANEKTVLGNFDGARFVYGRVTSIFYRRDGKYFVWTDGPDGRMAEFEITDTFGWAPLQQYLIPMFGGRRQALGIAWDARPASIGGQRWFHLYPDEKVTHDDVLHWTKPAQNWNDRCARCHATDLHKGYRMDLDRYETTAVEMRVSCEACHGPGSAHVAWARAGKPATDATKGLRVRFDDDRATWAFVGDAPIAVRSAPRKTNAELETCAPCHSRRGELGDAAPPGAPFLDGYRPAYLEEGLYFADGQIEDEVYEWASFLQSPMYRAGVTCSDCHDPHSLELRADGNALCGRCHAPAHYDTPAHHLHPAGSFGARCVACHMPARTYMQIDERRDHGFRVPRPDLAEATGAPDVCTSCHTDRTPAWAAGVIAARPGPHRAGTPHWSETIAAARRGAADSEKRLTALIADGATPAIVRGTAIRLLAARPSASIVPTLTAAAGDADPLIRLAALDAADGADPDTLVAIAGPRLDDPVRAVRLEAAAIGAAIPPGRLDAAMTSARQRAIDDYRTRELANADRPETWLDLGLLETKLGHADKAEETFARAIRVAPWFVPGYVNLADLYRAIGRDGEGGTLLRRAVAIAPDNAEAHHALGLWLVRQKQGDDALAEFAKAAELRPDARFAYVFGVALHSAGKTDRALEVLRTAWDRHPGDHQVLVALVTIERDSGKLDDAKKHADALVALMPNDEGAKRLRAELDAPR